MRVDAVSGEGTVGASKSRLLKTIRWDKGIMGAQRRGPTERGPNPTQCSGDCGGPGLNTRGEDKDTNIKGKVRVRLTR